MTGLRNKLLTLLAIALLVPSYAARAADIDFWTTEDEPDRLAVIRYLADSFMALHDDIRVQVIAVNENEMPHAIRAAKAQGKLPAMIYAGSEPLVSFAESGCLDTKTANALVTSLGRDRFFSGPMDALTNPATGMAYALPYHGWVQGIWYRADWFKEAGLAPPDSLENILAAAEALHNPEAGRWGLLVGTKRDTYAEQVFTHLALSRGVREFDSSGKLAFNSPQTVKLLKEYARLASFTPTGPQGWRARDFYLQGRLAMMFYSSFIMDDLALSSVAANSLGGDNFQELTGAPFDPSLLSKTEMVPVLKGSESAGYGVVVGIGFGKGQTYAQREAVIEFTRFLYRTDCYVTWLHMAPGGMLPVLRDVADMDIFYRDLQGVFRRYGRSKVNSVVRGLENVRSFSLEKGRLNPLSATIMAESVIPNMIHMTVFEDVPPAEAVAWAEKEMRKIIDRSR